MRLLLDRAGAILERYAYDSYGRPRIRESCGRGDMNDDTKMSSTDTTRFDDANDDTIWDPRADMDDDGDVDAADETAYDNKYSDWSGAFPSVDPRQAFSDKGNPFMFQGIPHFALNTASNATEGKLMLNHHRARFADPVTGRWITRDPLNYSGPENPSNWEPTAHGREYEPVLFHRPSKATVSFGRHQSLDVRARHNSRIRTQALGLASTEGWEREQQYLFLANRPQMLLDPTGKIWCYDPAADLQCREEICDPASDTCNNSADNTYSTCIAGVNTWLNARLALCNSIASFVSRQCCKAAAYTHATALTVRCSTDYAIDLAFCVLEYATCANGCKAGATMLLGDDECPEGMIDVSDSYQP